MDLTRTQWKNLLREINKGGLQKFKSLINEIEEEAYNTALQNAMSSVKSVVLDNVEKTLRKEFGFGAKRIEKFTEAFTQSLQEVVEKKDNTEAIIENPIDSITLSEADKTSFMIFLCVRHFIRTMCTTNSALFTDSNVVYHLNSAVAMMDFAEEAMISKITQEDLQPIYHEVTKRKLFLTGSDA